MKNKALHYQLAFWGRMTLICCIVIAANLLFAAVVSFFVNRLNPGAVGVKYSSIESIAFICMFIYGLIFFKSNFKFLLANGVSRRRFFWTNIQALAMNVAACAIAILLFQSIFKLFTICPLITEWLYKSTSLVSHLGWIFAALFLLVMSGWFINMIYYRSGGLLKLLISLAPFLLWPLLSGLNNLSGGGVYPSLGRFFSAFFGFSGGVPNPYTAAGSMLITAALLGGLNFLLIRKAQIKD